MIEQAMDKEISWDKLPDRCPHCDARILHKPEECVYCAKATVFQEERERLGVSNTGHANRKFPCPVDQARSKANYNAWHGNRAQTQQDIDRNKKEWDELTAEIIAAKKDEAT